MPAIGSTGSRRSVSDDWNGVTGPRSARSAWSDGTTARRPELGGGDPRRAQGPWRPAARGLRRIRRCRRRPDSGVPSRRPADREDGRSGVSHVFPRVLDRELPTGGAAEGAWITTRRRAPVPRRRGRRDRRERRARTTRGDRRDDRAAGSARSTSTARCSRREALEDYAAEVAAAAADGRRRVYPVSGGSEAVETALKLARTYHLARGERPHGSRDRAAQLLPRQHDRRARRERQGAAAQAVHALARALPARPARVRVPLREPRTTRSGCGAWHAGELERMIAAGRRRVGRGVHRRAGRRRDARGAAVPCEDYWPAVVEVCRRHGVLVIADEVMTGFGRTGRWFGVDHWDVRPDILTAGKGTTSGYVPFGFAAASGAVFEAVSDHRVRPRVHVVAQRARRGGGAGRRCGGFARTTWSTRARGGASGCCRTSPTALGDVPDRRRRPRPGH